MEEQLLKILSEEEYALSLEQLIDRLNIKKNEDIVALEKMLDELSKKGTIYYSEKKKTYLIFEKSHLKKGKLQVNPKGFGFVNVGMENDVYIDRGDLKDAIHGDVVAIEITDKTKGMEAGKVIKVLERKVESFVGEYHTLKNGNGYVILDDKKLNLNIDVRKEDSLNAVTGHKVRVRLLRQTDKRRHVYRGIITDVIGHKDDPFVDIISVAYQYGFTHKFSKTVMDEVRTLPVEVRKEDLVGRKDLRDITIFTIDGDDTKDIDDAISIKQLENKNYQLGVHIADVSYYVKENSPLDISAYERGTSCYLASSVLPMLPHELSNGICSLNPNVDRLAVSCIMEIDHQGNVVDYDIFPSVIHSRIQMTYKNVNKILEEHQTPAGYEPYVDDLYLMAKLAKILRKNKLIRGYTEFQTSEAKIITDEQGNTIDIQKRVQRTGENLIEDFMIAANETVATHITNMDLPFLYRVHESAKEQKLADFMKYLSLNGIVLTGKKNNLHPKDVSNILESLKEKENFPVYSQMLLECMTKAYYSKDNVGHFGLASRCYTHFTSPIRRYCDTTVHRLLRTYLFEGQLDSKTIDYWNTKLEPLASHISSQEVASVDCEREVDDMKIAEYMEQHIGEVYLGTIVKTLPFGMFVQLENLVEGLVKLKDMEGDFYTYKEDTFRIIGQRTGKTYQMGEKIRVKVIAASKEKRQIDFQIITE